MAQARRVLLADPDVNAVRALTKALRAKGYHVQYASDGSKALEVAVLRHPDVILFDELCTLIEGRSFVQILHTNPRTEDIPVVITTNARDLDRFRAFREGVLQKPFNLDEVLSRIDHLCRRSEAARQLRGDARDIEGGLSQLPLADLLQIMAMNRRTGRLALTRGNARGEIHISQGRPVNARVAHLEGEKALFRLLGWSEGAFAFHPGPAPSRAVIDRSMEDALLEGMRQHDERARLMVALPAPEQLLAVSANAEVPIEPHPVTREILRVLGHPRKLSEILDLADAPDLELLGALTSMLDKGLLETVASEISSSPSALLAAAEVHALRGRLMRGKPARNTLVAKVIVCATGPKGGRWFLRTVPGLVYHPDPPCLRSSFGTLGRLEVSEVLKVDFVLVPTAEAARPLWRPFVNTALGTLVMEDTEPMLKLARFCAFELRQPLVICHGNAAGGFSTGASGVPPLLRGAPAGAVAVTSDISSAIRTLLVSALQNAHGEQPDAMVAAAGLH